MEITAIAPRQDRMAPLCPMITGYDALGLSLNLWAVAPIAVTPRLPNQQGLGEL